MPDLRIESAVQVAELLEPGQVMVDWVSERAIRFEVLLPDAWDARFAMGGGLVGSVQSSVRGSVKDGYETARTGKDHQVGGTDGSLALEDPEASVNFGHMATHHMAD